jgi:hypothetical protein
VEANNSYVTNPLSLVPPILFPSYISFFLFIHLCYLFCVSNFLFFIASTLFLFIFYCPSFLLLFLSVFSPPMGFISSLSLIGVKGLVVFVVES